ncbi:hypothetical protein [Agrobacterium tumefaciens]|uniref:hypothetical protein n=1 Tax=Agrobacterium tumefaciens TaxID=358 RepID=UPI00287CC7C5|nr:hypothetical protein [Agrobacterium tumefaciens]MDS7598506.1 hypothetical protein [Agrobacterium tumefaciens]
MTTDIFGVETEASFRGHADGPMKHNYKAGPAFFATHSVSQLRQWPSEALDRLGTMPFPMRYDACADRYNAVEWTSILAEVGRSLARAEKVILDGAPELFDELNALQLIMSDVLSCPVVFQQWEESFDADETENRRVVILLGSTVPVVSNLGNGNDDLLVCLCEKVPAAMFFVSERAVVLPIAPNRWRLTPVVFHRLLRMDSTTLQRHQFQDFHASSNDLSQPLSSVLAQIIKYILIEDQRRSGGVTKHPPLTIKID